MKNEIHVWNLPIEKVYVKLKDGFREEFFEKVHKKFGSWTKLGNFLNVKRGDTTLAKNWKQGQCCCPLVIIFKISKILNISKKDIEKNIKEIKSKTNLIGRGGNSGKPIVNPKLPIKIDEEFAEVLGHICGDGTITKISPKKGIALKYINSEPKLIEFFQKKIKKIFGDIEANVQIRDGGGYRKKNYVLQYPTIISLFVLSVFNYQTKDKMTLPSFISKMSKKSRCYFLRALFDDEGTISIKEKRIVIGLKPRKPTEDIKDLLLGLGFYPTKIYKSGNILKISLQKKRDIFLFKKIIGFKHTSKKEKLDLIIKKDWKFDRNFNQETEQKIILSLKKIGEMETEEFIKLLDKSPSVVRKYLLKLKKDKLILTKKIKNNRGNGWHYLWSLK